MARELRRSRLDQPRGPRRGVRSPYDPETFGKLSERISRFIGSWRFIFYMTVFIAAWMLWNVFAPEDLRFDEWPFIGLTLMLSMQASYAAPLILLSQNRQADRDRVQYWEDRARIDRIIADDDFLTREVSSLRMAVNEVATRDFVRDQLRDLLDELDERAEPAGPTLDGSAELSRRSDPVAVPASRTAPSPAPRPRAANQDAASHVGGVNPTRSRTQIQRSFQPLT